jgi:hypothetical protein
LTLTDCDGIKGPSDPITGIKTNCLNKTLIYPSILPPEDEKPFYNIASPDYMQYSWLLEALRMILFLEWMTI